MATVLELDRPRAVDAIAGVGIAGVATPGVRRNGCRASTEAARLRAVERAVAAMRERLGEPLPLGVLARAALSSPFHFNRFFREVTGLPPCRFLSALRLEAAKRLLLTTRLSVTRICFDVGFASVGTFSRHFAGDVGLPPQRLRTFTLPPATLTQLLAPPRREVAGAARPAAPADAAIHGEIEAPEGFGGLVFVGVFPEPIPRGRPAACAVLHGPGDFRAGPLPDGRWHVLAVGVDDPTRAAELMHDTALRAVSAPVELRGGRAAEPVTLRLRPPSPVDPPILAPLPVLLACNAGGPSSAVATF